MGEIPERRLQERVAALEAQVAYLMRRDVQAGNQILPEERQQQSRFLRTPDDAREVAEPPTRPE